MNSFTPGTKAGTDLSTFGVFPAGSIQLSFHLRRYELSEVSVSYKVSVYKQ